MFFYVWYFNGCQHVPLNVGFKNINCLPFRFLSKQIMKSLVESSWVKWRKFCHQIAPSCIITLFCQIIQSLVKIIFRIFKMWSEELKWFHQKIKWYMLLYPLSCLINTTIYSTILVFTPHDSFNFIFSPVFRKLFVLSPSKGRWGIELGAWKSQIKVFLLLKLCCFYSDSWRRQGCAIRGE